MLTNISTACHSTVGGCFRTESATCRSDNGLGSCHSWDSEERNGIKGKQDQRETNKLKQAHFITSHYISSKENTLHVKDHGNKHLAASTATRSSRLFKASAACWARMDPPDGWAGFLCKSDALFWPHRALNSRPPHIELSIFQHGTYLHSFSSLPKARWKLPCSPFPDLDLITDLVFQHYGFIVCLSFPGVQFWYTPFEPHSWYSCTCVKMETIAQIFTHTQIYTVICYDDLWSII